MTQSGLRYLVTLCVALAWSHAFSSCAAAKNKTIDMTLTVLINGAAPCTIVGADVDFGNVLISNIDGTHYAQPINYSLNCGSRVVDDLKMQIQGTPVTINGESVLKTTVDGLGLRLKSVTDESVLVPGSSGWLNFQCQSNSCGPALQAIPVKDSNVTLKTGGFSASATLVVEYQ
ncbi:fimbrial protein [Salmonella enterica subsp. salamae]|nr:fimbrial protein [Salmonella enterica subsp. salamae]